MGYALRADAHPQPRIAVERLTFEVGGEAQRVSLARALANEPEVLLLDEPTAALDPTASQVIEDLLVELAADTDLTFVFVTHDLALARRIGDHGLLLVDGRVVDQGPLPALLDEPAEEVPRQFVEGRLQSGAAGALARRAARGRPMIAVQPFSFTSLAAAVVLVGLALLLSWRQHLDIETEMGFACIRAFVQLMAIGYVIHLILRADRPLYVVLMVAAMLGFAAATSARSCSRWCPSGAPRSSRWG
jgi:hypothetical protein